MSSTPFYQQGNYPQPVVVSGTYVPTPGQPQPQQAAPQVAVPNYPQHNASVTATDLKPDAPTSHPCQDMIWAIFFYVHLVGIAGLAVTFTPVMVKNFAENMENPDRRMQEGENGDGDFEFNLQAVMVVFFLSSAVSLVISTLALGFMVAFAETLVKVALIFNIVVFGLLGLMSLAGGAMGGGLFFLLIAALATYYAYRVWARIPFAAANLVTAVTAVKANLGLAFYAYLSMVLVFLWSVFWSISMVSTILVLGKCDHNGDCENETSPIIMFLFFVSYYWTIQVISNVVHCTTSGTVGTWWMVPQEANGCCSQAVRESYVRSLTTSFGSICLGSLLVAILQAVKESIHQAREQNDGLIACCAECLIGILERLLEYFNKWAFVYVGLYGFSFMEAGSNVMRLFRERGWTSIITDTMVDRVLFMVSAGVGVLVGFIALVLGAMQGGNDAGSMVMYFVIGIIVGQSMCITLFSVVSSAVNTVIVCYAEAPNDFQVNHPELSNKMREAWRQAWPADFHY